MLQFFVLLAIISRLWFCKRSIFFFLCSGMDCGLWVESQEVRFIHTVHRNIFYRSLELRRSPLWCPNSDQEILIGCQEVADSKG